MDMRFVCCPLELRYCRLISEGQHFSDEAMREREPFLYHQYIGQYEEGAVPPEDGAEPAGRHEGMLPDSLSAILLESHDKKERAGRRDAEEERYAMIEEETESDEEEEAAGMHERPATSAAAAAEAAEQALSPEERWGKSCCHPASLPALALHVSSGIWQMRHTQHSWKLSWKHSCHAAERRAPLPTRTSCSSASCTA